MIDSHFAAMIQAGRISKGFTMGDVARRLGLSVTEVSKLERGRVPPAHLDAFARELELSLEDMREAADHDLDAIDYAARATADLKLFWLCHDCFPGFISYAPGQEPAPRCSTVQNGIQCIYRAGHESAIPCSFD